MPQVEQIMKNPFMSLWLSYANTYANMMRGFWSAEMQRQQTAMMNAFLKNWMNMMFGAAPSSITRKSTRKSRDRK